MDAQSIITQANRDGTNPNPISMSSEAYEVPETDYKMKKKRHKSILSSLFCCFRCKKEPEPAEEEVPQNKTCSLLKPMKVQDTNKICLVIDLDETLVHSSFKPISNADFVVPVEIEDATHQVFVLKRPHVDEFLKRMGELYECVLFTASLAKYADPVADLLDQWGVFRARLFRESCIYHNGNYVKDLSRLGRDLNKVVIVDNSPASYSFHPHNAVPVASWFQDMNDRELLDLIPFLERLSKVDNIYKVLKNPPNPSGLSLISNSTLSDYQNSRAPLNLVTTNSVLSPDPMSSSSTAITNVATSYQSSSYANQQQQQQYLIHSPPTPTTQPVS